MNLYNSQTCHIPGKRQFPILSFPDKILYELHWRESSSSFVECYSQTAPSPIEELEEEEL